MSSDHCQLGRDCASRCEMEWIPLARSLLQLHSTTVQVFLLLLAALSALLLRRGRRPTQQWPPGPPAWPIIGHLHLLGKLPHQSLCKLSSTYGPLLGLRLGGVPTIVASSPQMAKEILQTHDLTFTNRPRFAAAVHMYFDCSDMGFVPYGPVWKLMRQLCATELFNAKRLASFRHVREDEVRGLVKALAEMGERGQRAVEVRPSLLAASNNITCRMAMGKKIAEVSGSGSELELGKQDFLSLVEELMHLLAVSYVGDFIPWLWWLDPHGYLKRMKAAGRKAKALMQDVIDNRRQEMRDGRGRNDSYGAEDLLDVLLAAAADPKQEVRLTDDNIMGLILDLFAGGSDTSSVTVEWALADLVSNERVMHKLQKEIDSMVGNERLVVESDIDNLPYLASVVKESMRLHPVAPLLIPHESIKVCQIGGYKIPAKTRAYVNTWAIGRDPLLWERVLEFYPERFENSNLDLRRTNFELLPFGAGRRGCPGWALGLLNVHLMLATLVQAFNWSLVSLNTQKHDLEAQFLDMSERFGLTVTLDKPLCVFLSPRLPLHMY